MTSLIECYHCQNKWRKMENIYRMILQNTFIVLCLKRGSPSKCMWRYISSLSNPDLYSHITRFSWLSWDIKKLWDKYRCEDVNPNFHPSSLSHLLALVQDWSHQGKTMEASTCPCGLKRCFFYYKTAKRFYPHYPSNDLGRHQTGIPLVRYLLRLSLTAVGFQSSGPKT